MKTGFGRYALVLALVCAMVAAWAHTLYLKSLTRTADVVVVVKEVQPFTAIPADAIKLVPMNQEGLPTDALTDVAAVKGFYSRTLLIPGTVVRKPHLVEAGGSNLAARLAVEKAYDTRAMALEVNPATGVAGTLREGDPVDILASIQYQDTTKQNKSGNSTLAKVIARRVPVVWVQRAKDDIASDKSMTVVLQVSPTLAEEIAFAQGQGKIWLLTSPYEAPANSSAETEGVDLERFLAKYRGQSAPAVAQQPAGPQQTAASSITPAGGTR
ncbi:MAG TPA: Flp pilus assembly protein CpaB [Symbiobacteriaceae bacterium]|jgi:Flp pilus assembly protein CpaB|nr:Flp pilus assembly protein CpaB [Symbiobacteriaceae bacterium]